MSGYAQDGFERSRTLFEQVVAELTAQDADEQTHAQLEEQVAVRGRELMRQLYQDHLGLRAARERRAEPVVDTEQVAHARVEGDHQRSLTTVFGQVTVSRMAYRAPGARNLYPADAILNLPAELYSYGLGKLVATESVRGSFEAAAAAVLRNTAIGYHRSNGEPNIARATRRANRRPNDLSLATSMGPGGCHDLGTTWSRWLSCRCGLLVSRAAGLCSPGSGAAGG